MKRALVALIVLGSATARAEELPDIDCVVEGFTADSSLVYVHTFISANDDADNQEARILAYDARSTKLKTSVATLRGCTAKRCKGGPPIERAEGLAQRAKLEAKHTPPQQDTRQLELGDATGDVASATGLVQRFGTDDDPAVPSLDPDTSSDLDIRTRVRARKPLPAPTPRAKASLVVEVVLTVGGTRYTGQATASVLPVETSAPAIVWPTFSVTSLALAHDRRAAAVAIAKQQAVIVKLVKAK